MTTVSVRIPQMGEGLQEALLVEFIKQPGDFVKRDEAIYVMETDKATTDVESPYTGRLVEWKVKPGTVLPIGTEVAIMEVDSPTPSGTTNPTPTHAPMAVSGTSSPRPNVDTPPAADQDEETESNVNIPPRTRKYLKDKGLLSIAHTIPHRGSKLTPDDVDAYLASHATRSSETGHSGIETQGAHAGHAIDTDTVADAEFDESPVSKQQITLNYRLVRSVQTTVPVTVMTEVDWTALNQARQAVKESGGKETGFSMMLWCVAQSLKRHPQFRTSLSADGTVFRTYRHVNFGVAVALPGDALVTAVVRAADTLTRSQFFEELNAKIELARQGIDQAAPSITISVSNIGSASMRFGIPAIVAPAASTLALGEVFDAPIPTSTGFAFQKRAQLTLAFDHRIINGAGAAAFMNDLKSEIQSFHW
jgi:pyruvate dehydrogenase E2 component (dihydrolipoamide acetyltransferase)